MRDKELKGVANLTIAIYDGNGTRIQAVGFTCTDAKGYFRLSFTRTDRTGDSENTTISFAAAAGTAARGPGVFIHVSDRSGAHIYVDQRPLVPQLGNVDYREIILGNGTGTCRPPDDDKGPRPV